MRMGVCVLSQLSERRTLGKQKKKNVRTESVKPHDGRLVEKANTHRESEKKRALADPQKH